MFHAIILAKNAPGDFGPECAGPEASRRFEGSAAGFSQSGIPDWTFKSPCSLHHCKK